MPWAERSVIGGVFLTGSWSQVPIEAKRLRPEDFTDESHRNLWDIILSLARTTGVVDAITVIAELESQGITGQRADILELAGDIPTNANLGYWARLVTEASRERLMDNAIAEATDAASCDLPGRKKLLAMQEALSSAALGSEEESAKLSAQLPDIFRSLSAGPPEAFRFGFAAIDNYVDGIRRGDMCVAAARPGVGKTAFALQIAVRMATRCRVFFASYEMSPEQLILRMVSSTAGVQFAKLRNRKISYDEQRRVSAAFDRLGKLELFMPKNPPRTPQELSLAIEAEGGADVLVLDYLQLMRSGGPQFRSESREREIGTVSLGVKEIALERNLAALALCQLNRTAVEGRPHLHQLRGSGQLEQDADQVLLLWAEENEAGDMKPEREIIVAKNRHGRVGKINMLFDGTFQKFTEAVA